MSKSFKKCKPKVLRHERTAHMILGIFGKADNRDDYSLLSYELTPTKRRNLSPTTIIAACVASANDHKVWIFFTAAVSFCGSKRKVFIFCVLHVVFMTTDVILTNKSGFCPPNSEYNDDITKEPRASMIS